MVVRVVVPAAEAELAADLLWQAGASAVGEAPAEGDGVELTADLDECPPRIAAAGWRWSAWTDDGAWQDGWRPFARAVRVGPFLVRPPWVDAVVDAGVVELVLDGGRAFGTGTHPSTTLALEALAVAVTARPGCSVLDAGCGSGALAVGAALLGARRVVAVDVDPAAVEATVANAAANGVTVDVLRADPAAVEGAFDVVVANLGSPLVVDLAPALAARTAPGGALVLSGMLDDRAAAVAAAYPSRTVTATRSADGWTTLVL